MMDLSALKDVSIGAVQAGMLWQILGPTAKYLGSKGKEYTQAATENLERIFKDAHAKLPLDSKSTDSV